MARKKYSVQGTGEKTTDTRTCRIIDELMEEHVFARKTVLRLSEANEQYLKGQETARKEIIACLTELANLYPPISKRKTNSYFTPA